MVSKIAHVDEVKKDREVSVTSFLRNHISAIHPSGESILSPLKHTENYALLRITLNRTHLLKLFNVHRKNMNDEVLVLY